ncbi:hypothetical protein BS17DRAFT_195221 [Gyrodon lividus]|nr:hypothetical protein BS17DRAFT_195221 [Gyrodon lividus]
MSVDCPSKDVVQFLLVFVTILHCIAVLMTFLRLWIRICLRRLWWEDAWAALALCLDVICAVSTWTLTSPEGAPPLYLSSDVRAPSLWLSLFSYTCLVWTARMSIVFSVIRLAPPSNPMRAIAWGVAILFFLLWALVAASTAYTCSSDTSWYETPGVECRIGMPIAIIEFTTDLVSDIILVAIPVRMLWHDQLPRNERILILSIFSMSLISCSASVVHVAFLIPTPGFMAAMTAGIEGAMGLMICNLLVLVTYLYRVFRNGVDIESTCDPTQTIKSTLVTSSRTTIATLTTVDLEHFTSISIQSTGSTPIIQAEALPIPVRSGARSYFDISTEFDDGPRRGGGTSSWSTVATFPITEH